MVVGITLLLINADLHQILIRISNVDAVRQPESSCSLNNAQLNRAAFLFQFRSDVLYLALRYQAYVLTPIGGMTGSGLKFS